MQIALLTRQNKRRKRKKKTRISPLALEVNEKYKVLNGNKEKRYWNLSSLEKC